MRTSRPSRSTACDTMPTPVQASRRAVCLAGANSRLLYSARFADRPMLDCITVQSRFRNGFSNVICSRWLPAAAAFASLSFRPGRASLVKHDSDARKRCIAGMGPVRRPGNNDGTRGFCRLGCGGQGGVARGAVRGGSCHCADGIICGENISAPRWIAGSGNTRHVLPGGVGKTVIDGAFVSGRSAAVRQALRTAHPHQHGLSCHELVDAGGCGERLGSFRKMGYPTHGQ